MVEGVPVTTSARYLAPSGAGAGDVWAADAAAGGHRGTQEIVRAGEVDAPGRVAVLLGLGKGQRVVERRRVMYLDGVPCELTDTYYPARIARGTKLAGTARIRGGAVRLLAELGHVGVKVQEEVVARMPTKDERVALAVDGDVPVLELIRLTLDAHDRPVQADVMVMPPGGQRLRYEIRIG
ncbi:UTRA domain-containing protein [Streptomyces sp. NPDC005752]|uniref:GntR family transcriptional regulator n=1 Tax=Streptomyces sp. NPDC005752 TaxID=3157065 RepID=UPI0033FEFA05